MGFQLRIEDGSYVQTLEVRTGALTVGRNPPNGLALTSPGLSARHAIFRQAGHQVELEALATKVGVRFRGERVDSALLSVGDSIQVGWARITVLEVTPETAVPSDAAAAAAASDTPAPLAFEPSTPQQPRLALEETGARSAVAEPVVEVPAAERRPVTAPAMDHARFEPSPATAHVARRTPLHTEPAADFVVVSRQAVRVLPWWGISIAIHAILLGIVLLIPRPPREDEPPPDSMLSVTLRNAAPFVDPAVPPVEPTRRAVDLARPDMAVPVDTPDSTLPVSANPKGQEGTSTTRSDETIVLDDPGGGNPWAQPGGSSAIGVGSGARFGSGVGTNMDETFGKGDAGRANAAAAGKLNGDPFTRALVNGLRLRTNEQNVKVVSGDYDHGELVMSALGLHHGFLTADELGQSPIGDDVRAIFYDCTGRPAGPRTLANLERWVSEGGFLFTTDWQVDNVVEKAFPGYIKVVRNGARQVMTPDETITFTIAPGTHALLAGLPPEAEASRWWLEESSILFAIEKPAVVEVLAVSKELERRHGSNLVAVTFPHGKGRVVHALGHMYQKEGNLRGAYAMQRLLLNFLYQAIRGK